jgi:hypothetical protein
MKPPPPRRARPQAGRTALSSTHISMLQPRFGQPRNMHIQLTSAGAAVAQAMHLTHAGQARNTKARYGADQWQGVAAPVPPPRSLCLSRQCLIWPYVLHAVPVVLRCWRVRTPPEHRHAGQPVSQHTSPTQPNPPNAAMHHAVMFKPFHGGPPLCGEYGGCRDK